MVGLRFLAVLTIVTLSLLVSVSESTVVCPGFPNCCYTNTCHILCPSCREAEEYEHGIRKKTVFETILEENAEKQEEIEEEFHRTGMIPGTRQALSAEAHQAFRRARRPGISFVAGSPFAFPGGRVFPASLAVL